MDVVILVIYHSELQSKRANGERDSYCHEEAPIAEITYR